MSGVWVQDWCGCRKTKFGYQVMWNWQADETLYPNLSESIESWKNRGIRFLGYVNPFLALEKNLYKTAHENGWCVKNAAGEDYLVTITTFPAAMVDLSNPKAYEWYKSVIKGNLLDAGMGGWMADFGEYLPTDAVLFSGESAESAHNKWPALWAKLNREVLEESGAIGRAFFFTRAGHTESVRYSTLMWNGDQHVDFSIDDGLPSVIPATLSLSVSGFGLCHSDVGGYTTAYDMARSKEVFMRWAEMNAFSLLMRSHEGNQPSRNIQFDSDDEILSHLGKFVRIHVGLKNYLKAAVKENAESGIPVVRPIFFHYGEERAFSESYEYLLGRDILVSPVLHENESKKTVWLPADEWVHLFSGESFRGGEHEVDCPIGTPPVFIRASSLWRDEILKVVQSESGEAAEKGRGGVK